MGNAIVLLAHLLARLSVLFGPCGIRNVLAENILLKQQLLDLQRSRRRAPNLRTIVAILYGMAPSSGRGFRLSRCLALLLRNLAI